MGHRMAWVMVLLAGGPASGAGTLHVNASCGNDAWSGGTSACVGPSGPKRTVQAALNAAQTGDEIRVAPGVYPGQVNFLGKAVRLYSAGGAAATVLDGQGAHQVVLCLSGEGPQTTLEGLTIRRGSATAGGGMHCVGSSPTVLDCVFTDNTASVGGAVRSDGGAPTFRRCTFSGNTCLVAGAGIASSSGSIRIIECDFIANGGASLSAMSIDFNAAEARIVSCRFIQNESSYLGAAATASNPMFVNCLFSRNTSAGPVPATLLNSGNCQLINCTLTGDNGRAVQGSGNGTSVTLLNCIAWENDVQGFAGAVYALYSDVQGGWAGAGNLNVNPHFVAPGLDDARLSFGSPCRNVALAELLPPDADDLDHDGNTTEPIPRDMIGKPRIQASGLDMGALEGAYPPGPPADSTVSLDQGSAVVLVPQGGAFDPLNKAVAVVSNVSGPDNAMATVLLIDTPLHPGAGGFTEQTWTMLFRTSLAPGQVRASLFIPIHAGMLDGATPQQLYLTRYDEVANSWAVAVSANSGPSPGFSGAIGNRQAALEGGPFGLSSDLGDYGVYWDPALQKGFVWANVDRDGDFGVGVPVCPADCHQSPDGDVDVLDLLSLLAAWGTTAGGGPCDLDANGTVGVQDFLALLIGWGHCVQPVSDGGAVMRQLVQRARGIQPLRSPDLDGSGTVDQRDYLALVAAIGKEHAGAFDLDGDGKVGEADAAVILANWSAGP